MYPYVLPREEAAVLGAVLRLLGFESYQDYLNGGLSEQVRTFWAAEGRLQLCYVGSCGRTDFQLHHRTYRRLGLGLDELEDLVPVCPDHHYELHKFIARYDLALYDGHTAYAEWLEARSSKKALTQFGDLLSTDPLAVVIDRARQRDHRRQFQLHGSTMQPG
jgi:hypothetical protein